jgi:hypothetical protein
MPKDSRRIVANWLVRLLGSALGRGSSEHHVNRLRPKGKLPWGFIAKATGFRMAVGIKMWHILVSVVR